MKKEESKPFKDMLPMTETSLAEFKKNPIPIKKETLEEISRRQQLIISEPNGIVRGTMIANLLIDIEERNYSEEDMREAFIAGGNSQIEEDDAYGSGYLAYMEEWFKQFKKK